MWFSVEVIKLMKYSAYQPGCKITSVYATIAVIVIVNMLQTQNFQFLQKQN